MMLLGTLILAQGLGAPSCLCMAEFQILNIADELTHR